MPKTNKIYNPPQSETPRVALYPAVISIVFTVLMVVFAGILIVLKMLPWYANIFVILVVVSNVAIVLWLIRLNIIRQHDIDSKYREQFITVNKTWITNTVIPKIFHSASMKLSFDEAIQLVYEGSITKRLDEPYNSAQYMISFSVDERRNPIIEIRQMMDYFDSASPHTELVANIPFTKSKKRLFTKR